MDKTSFKCDSCGANIKKEEKVCSYCACENKYYEDISTELKQNQEKIQEIVGKVFSSFPSFMDVGSFWNSNDES